MAQGVFVNGRRCKSKTLLKQIVKANPHLVDLEATSIFGNEHNGPLTEVPDGKYYVVGPCPATSRRWFAQIIKENGKVTVK